MFTCRVCESSFYLLASVYHINLDCERTRRPICRDCFERALSRLAREKSHSQHARSVADKRNFVSVVFEEASAWQENAIRDMEDSAIRNSDVTP